MRVHSDGRVRVMRSTMDKVAMRLAANASFVRIRRSAIVNIRAVAELERYDRWSYVVHLRSGAKIISSRHYRRAMRALTRPE